MKFNIDSLAMAPTGTMPIKNLSGEQAYNDDGEPLSITFHSPGTFAYLNMKSSDEDSASDRMIAKMQGKPIPPLSAEEKLAKRAKKVASVVVSMNNFGDCTALEFFSNVNLAYQLDEVDKFYGELANFKKPAVKS